MADTLSANVAELTQEIIDATVMQMPSLAPMINLVERKTIQSGKNALEIPRANSTFAVQTPTDGDELVNTSQFDLTSSTITPTLRALHVRISERAQRFSQEDILSLVSQELSRAQAQDIDDDITAEFANVTATAGTTNTDITIADLRNARRQLMDVAVASGGPAPDPLFAVLAPIPVENLLTNLGLQGTVAVGTATGEQFIPQGMSSDFIRQYGVNGMPLVGVDLFWDGYITEDANSDDLGCMFSRQAFQLAMSKDWDMKTFEESNWIGTILRAVADYNSGIGKYNAWAVQLIADGA
jgi:hypothetical protein